MVELKGVSKTFLNKIHALKDVDLHVGEGQIVAVLGLSGSGKSTLLRVINGLEIADKGQNTVCGERVEKNNLRRIRHQVGMVFQHASLIPRMSVMSNVLIGRLGYRSWLTNLFGWFPPEDHQMAGSALQQVKLIDRAWDRADQLSGGQQQRVGIARTLVQQAKVILADEPVASLDPETSQEVMRILVNIARNSGTTLIINLHQVELALAYCDRIVGLREGRVVTDLPTSKVTESVLREIYLGHVPHLDVALAGGNANVA